MNAYEANSNGPEENPVKMTVNDFLDSVDFLKNEEVKVQLKSALLVEALLDDLGELTLDEMREIVAKNLNEVSDLIRKKVLAQVSQIYRDEASERAPFDPKSLLRAQEYGASDSLSAMINPGSAEMPEYKIYRILDDVRGNPEDMTPTDRMIKESLGAPDREPTTSEKFAVPKNTNPSTPPFTDADFAGLWNMIDEKPQSPSDLTNAVNAAGNLADFFGAGAAGGSAYSDPKQGSDTLANGENEDLNEGEGI